MARLRERLAKLEGPQDDGQVQVIEGGVVYAGPRDPVAIINALGLQHMPALSIEVLDEGSPDNPPRLVGELPQPGSIGRTPELAAHRRLHCDRAKSGGSWFFYWRRGGSGFVLDWCDPSGVIREYECGGE